jgi:hypothetical protein
MLIGFPLHDILCFLTAPAQGVGLLNSSTSIDFTRMGSVCSPVMNDATTRLEILLPTVQRAQLDELGRETGLSTAALARIGLGWLLKNKDVLTDGPERERAA